MFKKLSNDGGDGDASIRVVRYWSFPFLCMGMVNPDFIMDGIWRVRIIDVKTVASTGAMMDELYLRCSADKPISSAALPELSFLMASETSFVETGSHTEGKFLQYDSIISRSHRVSARYSSSKCAASKGTASASKCFDHSA